MSKLYSWQNECRMVGTKVTCLESDISMSNSGLFQCITGYSCGGIRVSNYPVYHIWIDDKNVKTTSNYTEAYNFWKNRNTLQIPANKMAV